MSRRLVTRRSFVIGVVAASGSLLVRRLAPWRALVEVDRASRSRLARLFRQTAAAVAVGRWYLAHTPDEGSAAMLTAAVRGVLPAGAVRGREVTLRGAIAHRVDHEFSTGDVVQLDGWIVSRTEARLCALAALEFEL